MKVKYLKLAAGVEAGTERDLPEALAKALISKGVVEEMSSKPAKFEQKEVKVELETKENKFASRRKTKNRK